MPNYRLGGLHIASHFVLPGVPAWQGTGAPDVTISRGQVPDRLPGAQGNTFQVASPSNVRVQFPRVGAFLVEDGQRVTFAAAPAATDKDIALFLLGSVFGLLCHQRGLFPLHASAVEIGGRAFAFAGDSGAGKSTTAAALVQLGHPLLSDDVAVIDLGGKSPMLVSSSPTQKLWGDSLLALDIQAGGRVRPQLDMDKFERHVGDAFGTTPRPLAAIYHLETDTGEDRPMVEPIAGVQAVQAVRRQIYRLQAAQEMGMENRLFMQSAMVASAVPQFTLRRPRSLDQVRVFATAVSESLTTTP